MKILLFTGLLLVVLGIASLVVPIPSSEKRGIKIGDTNIRVQTSHSERVSPIISAVLIAGGITLAHSCHAYATLINVEATLNSRLGLHD
jgi:hypothetical protein